jgi:hypothetical protein
VTAAVLALLLCAAPSRAAEASRPPEKGCAWKRLSDRKLGLELLYQKCDFGYRTVDFEVSAKEGVVYELLHDAAKGSKDSREPVIRVFTKPSGESISDAIRRVALASTPADRAPHCRAVPAKDKRLLKGRHAYDFAPDDEVAILKKAAGEIPDPPCGSLGVDYDSQSYWEYHPSETTRRFAHVSLGQDEHPDFDELSLKFSR